MNNIKKILTDTNMLSSMLDEIKYNEKHTDKNWNLHTSRQKKISVHKHTECIPLVTTNVNQTLGKFRRVGFLDTNYPVAKEMLDLFESICGGVIVNAMYVKLFPEHKIYPHRDNFFQPKDCLYYIIHDRYHFVVQGRYELIVEDEKEICSAGDLVFFKNELEHSVINLEPIDRIALIFDVRPYEHVE